VPLQVPLQDLEAAAAAAVLDVCVALDVLFQVVPTSEGLVTLEATNGLATATGQLFLASVDLWKDRWAGGQRQFLAEIGQGGLEHIKHAFWPKFAHSRWKSLFEGRFILQSARKNGQ
jgi:hypothetical protein